MKRGHKLSRRDFLYRSALTTGCAALAASGGVPLAGVSAATAGSSRPYLNPYEKWSNGPNPHPDPSYFPIGVWLQSPQRAPQYKEAGINCYVGLWQGPTEEQLTGLREHRMPVICDQNEVGLKHKDDPIIIAWSHQDEPDNAQPRPEGGYGPPVDPDVIIEKYKEMAAADPSRPVFLNLGQGVANDDWIGRGPDASLDDYPEYCKGTDIVSFDVYPVANGEGQLPLWYVAKGVDRLQAWCDDSKVVWNFIETTNISSDRQATPHQLRAEVWMSLIHGSRGILYFVHRFEPAFDEAGLLHDPEMLAAVTAVNHQIHQFAPILNTRTVTDEVTVESSDPDVPIDTMVKRDGGSTYLFAVGMRDAETTGTFEFRGGLQRDSEVTVIGENRTLKAIDGRFVDVFDPYDVHLYRVVQGTQAARR